MATLKTLILHPDPQVRHDMREKLKDEKLLKVVGEAVSAFEAMEMQEALGYAIFFLGVDLPDGVDGFELAQMLSGRKNRPALVFLAEDGDKAYRAFELGATDYLILPADSARLAMTMEKLRQFKSSYKVVQPQATDDWESEGEESNEETVQLALGDEEQESMLQALTHAWDMSRVRTPVIEKLPVTQDGRMILIPYDQIIFVEAYEDYSYVHTANQKFLTSYRLKNLEDRLTPHRFFRVHRKYLVNLDMVTEIASLPGSNFMLRTTGKTRIELPISRRRIARLKEILGM